MRIARLRSTVATATALSGLLAGGVAMAPAASAVPGACVQPETKDFYIKTKGLNNTVEPDDTVYAKYSVRIGACPDQTPSSWTIAENAKELSAEGRLWNKEIHGEVIPISTTANERVIDLTMKLKQCVPGYKVLGGPCWDDAVFSKRFTLTKVGNEMRLNYVDGPSTGGPSQWSTYVTELPQQ